MPPLPEIPKSASLLCRRLLGCGVLAVCALVLVRAVALEPFEIPTGSMAPTLRGQHRACPCPRCGHEVVVGRARDDHDGKGDPHHYRKAFCSNCGLLPVPITAAAEVAGDRILVNKAAFLHRSPRRWEIIVFRLFGTFYIKRLLGLPGEEILIHDGDLYVDGWLSRKTLAEARGMRVPIFDHDHAPPEGWGHRWQGRRELLLDGRLTPDELAYSNFLLDAGKCEPIRDEYEYNAGLHADSQCVHDFMIETDIEIRSGHGSLTLRLSDGQDQVEVVLPVGECGLLPSPPVLRGRGAGGEGDRPTQKQDANSRDTEPPHPGPLPLSTGGEGAAGAIRLLPGCRYHVEMAFVDRRLSVAIDGRLCLSADWPAAKQRAGVVRPFSARADGVAACLHCFRMYRDIHYTQQGQNAVRGKSVRMGVDQFFVVGDNSPCSEDSRTWPDQGAVRADCLVGAAVFR